YVLIAGAPPSAIRSAVMFSVLALSAIYERESQPLNTLCAAAFVLLVGEPAWLFSVGFLLSFAGVLSLVLFYMPIYPLWPQTSLAGRALWQAVSASIAAEVLTAPLVAYYFHSFPLLFIPANLLSVVLAGGCALVGGMAVIALSGIPALAGAVGWAVTKLVWLFNAAVLWLQQYNPPAFQYLQISLAELLLLYIVIAASAAWWLALKRQVLPVALAAACVLMALLNRDHYAALRQDRLVVYSSGRQPLVERIRGRCYSGLAGEGAATYNAKAAHTGWHAWRGPVGRSAPFLAVGDKAVFILDDTA